MIGAIGRRSWWNWITVPWRAPGVAMALVGALALPALLLAAGPMFEVAAADEITQDVLADVETRSAGLVVSGIGAIDDTLLPSLTEGIEARFDAVDGLGPLIRTMVTDDRAVTEAGEEPIEGARAEVRFLSRPGARTAVELLRGTGDGALIPASMAGEYGLGPGDSVRVGGGAPVTIGGVYRDLWDGEPAGYWSGLPPEFVPRYLHVFRSPSFELVIVDEDVLLEQAAGGRVRWEAALVEPPDRHVALERLVADYRSIERDLVRETVLADTYRAWAENRNDPPIVFTAAPTALDQVEALRTDLRQPVRTTTIAGTVAGLLLSTLGAIFLIRRRRTDYRLMAADGDAAWRFFGRALAQYALPALTAAVLGSVGAWLAIAALGPSGTADVSVVPWGDVVAVTMLAALLAGVVTAAIAVRLVDSMQQPIGTIRSSWLLLLTGATATMWVQVGRADSRDVDPLVVAFPLTGIVTGVVLAVAALRLALRAARRTGRTLPTSLFLAWRALAASQAGALLLTVAIGLATGLAVLSAAFVDTIDTATEAKAATVAGAPSHLHVLDRVEEGDVPGTTTIVLTQSTRVGERNVFVIAVDPATYADAVSWPDSFGGTADDLVDVLATDTPDAVPAVLVEGRAVPGSSEFGTQRLFPYRVVGTVASAPLASTSRATLLVRADVLERFAFERWEEGSEPIDPIDRQVADSRGVELPYESPLAAFGNTVLSREALADLESVAASRGWRVRESFSESDVVSSIDAQAIRWAFDYVSVLAVVAGSIALAVLTFYLAERRNQREVAAVMTRQMGIDRRTNVVAAMAEMVGLVSTSVIAGSFAALVTARRVFPAFEPDPGIPPNIDLVVEPTSIVILLVVVAVAVASIAAWSQRTASSVEKARVLRG